MVFLPCVISYGSITCVSVKIVYCKMYKRTVFLRCVFYYAIVSCIFEGILYCIRCNDGPMFFWRLSGKVERETLCPALRATAPERRHNVPPKDGKGAEKGRGAKLG